MRNRVKSLFVGITLVLFGGVGCAPQPNDYFVCDGYESKNYSTNTTSSFADKESLVINQETKSLTFNFMDTNYSEPRPNYIFSEYRHTEESEETHLLKFDVVTGELTWTIGQGEKNQFGDTPITYEFLYWCKKVERLIK